MEEPDLSPNAANELLTPASMWLTYHEHQKKGLDRLFPPEKYDTSAWLTRQYCEYARDAWAELSPQNRTSPTHHIQKAIDGRVEYSKRFSYSTALSRAVHEHFIQVLEKLLAIGKTSPIAWSKGESDNAGHDDRTNASQSPPVVESSASAACDDVPTALEENASFSFLEAVKATSTRICGLWSSLSDGRHELSSVAARAIYEHQDLEQVLHQCHLLNPEWIRFALDRCSKFQFWPDFKVGYQAFINELHEKPSKDTLRFLVFKAGILCTIILSQQHDEELLSQHKAGLRMTCKDLQSLSSDEKVTMIMNAASSATNIITIGCLQAWAEANRKRLLHDRLGEPLISAVVHFYTFHKLHEAVSVSPLMDELSSRFEKLIFWDGQPKDVSSCQRSASEWIADLKGRSLSYKDFYKDRFNARKRRMTEKLLLIMIIGRNVKQASMSSAQGTAPLARIDQDCHHFVLLRSFVDSVDNVIPRNQERTALELVREIHQPTLDKTNLRLLETIFSQWSKSRAIP